MSAAQAYYDQVLSMGHSHENALAHTRQHYPDFVPGIAEAVAAPVMTPVSQQAIPAAQNVALPGTIGAPAVAAPVAPVAAPAATAANAYAPLASTPLPEGGTTPMMWGAVACIVLSVMLSTLGQFSHHWLDKEDGMSQGLTTLRYDCSTYEYRLIITLEQYNEVSGSQEQLTDEEWKEYQINLCKENNYLLLAEDMEAALAENKSGDELHNVIVGDMDDYCNNLWSPDNASLLVDEEGAEILRKNCLEDHTDGETASSVLWAASGCALLGTIMLGAALFGRNLPRGTERHGKWMSGVAGLLMLTAVIAWWFLISNSQPHQLKTNFMRFGSGVWMTVLAGVLGVVAGVLAYLDQK